MRGLVITAVAVVSGYCVYKLFIWVLDRAARWWYARRYGRSSDPS